ncbi:hypothetical protein Q5H92_25305 [Hymenobacter sp. M29]|uniref:DUF2335 domain-containing protein n=1 Tax=Hymenobacter mellowenesis TaxID=3063995 RepID=A0ABT9AIL4_9BACT|nr:hypothetical protein [Hymenobacter sp. M29]MDO7849705.1 hypothetical protein [Hymenobacter sp. M29]
MSTLIIPPALTEMNYREQYAKREAIYMYARGRHKEEVIAMLKREGAGESAKEFGESYLEDYVFIKQQQRKKTQKSANIYRIVGIVFLAGTLAYGLLTYWALGNGSYVVFTGLAIAGIALLIKGLVDQRG